LKDIETLEPALSALDPSILRREVTRYARPAVGRSLFELAVTAIPFIALLVLMWLALSSGYWLALLLALPAGAFLMRLFMIQHDCGHGAFFSRRRANDWVGRVLGVLTFTPYDYFKRSHALHHATMGNLDKRGMGDVATLTVGEYRQRSWFGRLLYRIYRHPLILFGIGPAFLFVLQFRLPLGLIGKGAGPWISTMATNVGIAALLAAAVWLVGWMNLLLIYVPILLLAATAGVWLFYVQHQFEHTRWDKGADWRFHDAALHGSSYYALPRLLRWVTANIGVHHVHHLSSRIPFYRLEKVLRDRPELRQIGRITLRQSLGTVRLALWDEESRRLVSFRQAKNG
jgi:acyl-lipid omega-6 desaturase (Delta-12 desaturase)